MKKPISIRAVEARIRRALKKENSTLTKFSPKWQSTYGEYGVISSNNVVSDHGRTLEGLAKEYGVLAEYEEIVE